MIIKNYQLTNKALEFIFKNGRNTFDLMILKLIKEGKSPIKEGWQKGINNV